MRKSLKVFLIVLGSLIALIALVLVGAICYFRMGSSPIKAKNTLMVYTLHFPPLRTMQNLPHALSGQRQRGKKRAH